MADQKEMPTWGWGDPDHARVLGPAAAEVLAARLGYRAGAMPAVVDPGRFDLPEPQLGETAVAALRGAAGDANVRSAPPERLLRASGKSYPDLLRMRAGQPQDVPDLVVRPRDHSSLQRVLSVCSEAMIAVTPFGGGTSVVGGLNTVREGFSGAVSLDLSGMTGMSAIDLESRLATFLPGTRGPAAESALASFGLTLGHFPQSFEYGSIGGFVATRSAGQSSTGYGRIDRNVVGVSLTAPVGRISLDAFPGTAAGPDLRQLIVGSEGALGVIDEVVLETSARPELTIDRAWIAQDFGSGREALRILEQAGCAPAVARLSDAEETEVSMLLAAGSSAGRALAKYMRLRKGSHACLLVG